VALKTSTEDKPLSWQNTTNLKVIDHGTRLLYLLGESALPATFAYSTHSFSTPCPGLSQKHFASHFATPQADGSQPHHVDPYLLNNTAWHTYLLKSGFCSGTLMKV
jgi:hypothetical protein